MSMTDVNFKQMYVHYCGEFLTVESFAKHYGISVRRANAILRIGQIMN